jgi:UDP:flavonoid glycosyltransferase YjiC (YdhE family)
MMTGSSQRYAPLLAADAERCRPTPSERSVIIQTGAPLAGQAPAARTEGARSRPPVPGLSRRTSVPTRRRVWPRVAREHGLTLRHRQLHQSTTIQNLSRISPTWPVGHLCAAPATLLLHTTFLRFRDTAYRFRSQGVFPVAHVIATATPFHGHVQPVLTIVAELVRRGHEVDVLTGARFADDVRSAGAHHVPLPPAADYDDRKLDLYFPERAAIPAGPAQLEYDLKYIFGAPTAAQSHALRALLARSPATVVISEPLFFGAAAFALSAPPSRRPAVIGVGTTLPTLLSDDAPPLGLAMPPVVGEQAKTQHRAMNAQVRKLFADTQQYLEKSFGESGTELPGFILDCMVTVPDHYLQLSVPGFEYPRGDLPPTFRFAGPLPTAPRKPHALPDWWAELEHETRPVVLVTQGSFANGDLTQLVRPAVDALADEDALVVAVTGRSNGPADLGPVPRNVRVGGYVPHEELLPYASVLVTNGGYGGVHTALWHGVPLVVAGAGEDKPEVAARVGWSGVGIDLRTGTPSREAIRSAVRTVLAEPGHRERAARLRDEFHRYDALEVVAELVAGM